MPEKKGRKGADIAYEKAEELLKSGREGLGKLGRRVRANVPGPSEVESFVADLMKGPRRAILGNEKGRLRFSRDMKATRDRANRRRLQDAIDREDMGSRMSNMSGLRGGGKVKMGYKKGGSVKKSSKKSIDGLAQRGRTRGTMR